MGWSTMAMPSEGARAFLDGSIYSWVNNGCTHRVIDSCLSGREYYAAIETIDHATGARQVFAGVALISISRRPCEEFGYKGMSEDMGPYYYNCPLRILDKLTPTTNAIALEWRAKCRATAALRSTKGKGPKLVAGQRVRFAEPIRFQSDKVLSEFEVEARIFGKGFVFIDPDTRNRYEIRSAARRARMLVTRPSADEIGCN